jgi:hypothetical protein
MRSTPLASVAAVGARADSAISQTGASAAAVTSARGAAKRARVVRVARA